MKNVIGEAAIILGIVAAAWLAFVVACLTMRYTMQFVYWLSPQ